MSRSDDGAQENAAIKNYDLSVQSLTFIMRRNEVTIKAQ